MYARFDYVGVRLGYEPELNIIFIIYFKEVFDK